MNILVHFPHAPERIVIQGRIRGIEDKLHELKEQVDLAAYRIRMHLSRGMINAGVDDEAHLKHVSACVDTLLEEAFHKRWQQLCRDLDDEGGDPTRWPFPRVEG